MRKRLTGERRERGGRGKGAGRPPCWFVYAEPLAWGAARPPRCRPDRVCAKPPAQDLLGGPLPPLAQVAGLGSQRIHARWLLVPDHSIVSSLRPRLRPRSPGAGSQVTPRHRHDLRPLSRLRLLQPESRSRSQDVAPVPGPHTRPSLPGPGTGAKSPPGGFESCPQRTSLGQRPPPAHGPRGRCSFRPRFGAGEGLSSSRPRGEGQARRPREVPTAATAAAQLSTSVCLRPLCSLRLRAGGESG